MHLGTYRTSPECHMRFLNCIRSQMLRQYSKDCLNISMRDKNTSLEQVSVRTTQGCFGLRMLQQRLGCNMEVPMKEGSAHLHPTQVETIMVYKVLTSLLNLYLLTMSMQWHYNVIILTLVLQSLLYGAWLSCLLVDEQIQMVEVHHFQLQYFFLSLQSQIHIFSSFTILMLNPRYTAFNSSTIDLIQTQIPVQNLIYKILSTLHVCYSW